MYGLGGLARVEESGGFLYALDARVKLVMILLVSVLSVVIDSGWSLLVLFTAASAAVIFARVGAAKLKFLAMMTGLLIWGTMFSQAIFFNGEPRTILLAIAGKDTPLLGAWLGEVNVYKEGLAYGAVQSLRFCSMVSVGLLVCWTTGIDGMLSAMLALRVPYLPAFMTVTAIRFLPAIADEIATVRLAMRMRGGKLLSPNPAATLVNCLKLARPVFMNCYRRSGTLALSVQSRAFTPGAERTGKETGGFKHGDAAVLWSGIVFTLIVVAAKVMFWMYLTDIYYNSSLRFLYDICRRFI